MDNYNRQEAVKYANQWAYRRNPKYYNYDTLGGDCTNFISQCLYAGSGKMSYNKQNPWYYHTANDKTPSWTGVEFLHQFLTRNKGEGPLGKEVSKEEVEKGDVIQLSFDGNSFTHSLLVIEVLEKGNLDKILIASHTFDSNNRRVSSYNYQKIRYIHILGVNT